MKTNDKVVEQFRRMADMLVPFAAGLSSENEYDAAAGRRMADPRARQWHGMFTVAAALLERQSCSINESQLLYLQRTFVGGLGSFQDFRLDGAIEVNTEFDLQRDVLLDLLADCHSETAQSSKESA